MTRDDLRKDLQDKGFTYREADKILTAIVESCTQHLKANSSLELPFGTITMERIRPHRHYKLGRIVEYRRPRFTFKENTDV